MLFRSRFQQLLISLKLKQPANSICKSRDEVIARASEIGYPVVIRPSYVLGGRAMAIIHDAATLKQYVGEIIALFGEGPILIDGYLNDAIELDVDALSDGKDVYVAGIMEHIEEAGIHSGDSACSLPPYSLDETIISAIREQTIALAKALKVNGLMNVQFAVKDGQIYIIEVNPRASRTVPFVAKSTGVPIAKIAARLMAGETLKDFALPSQEALASMKHVAVKEAVFPFARFPGVDVILGPEMKSTGEAMGLDMDFSLAYAKAHLASGSTLPSSGTVFVSVKESDKPLVLPVAKTLEALGFSIIATRGTASFLQQQGVTVEVVNKVREGRPHIVDKIKNGDVALLMNTTEGAAAIADSYSIRRTALLCKTPYTTTIPGAKALARALEAIAESKHGLTVRPLQAYFQKEQVNQPTKAKAG